jgi:hypothetical protein
VILPERVFGRSDALESGKLADVPATPPTLPACRAYGEALSFDRRSTRRFERLQRATADIPPRRPLTSKRASTRSGARFCPERSSILPGV